MRALQALLVVLVCGSFGASASAAPPSHGTCKVEPPSGVAQQTPFTLSCTGWVGTAPLTYEWGTQAGDGPVVPLRGCEPIG